MEVRKGAAERGHAHVLDREADRGVNGIRLPDPGRHGLDCFGDAHLVGLLPAGILEPSTILPENFESSSIEIASISAPPGVGGVRKPPPLALGPDTGAERAARG